MYKYLYFEEIDSTNNEVKRQIADGRITDTTLIVAKAQTAGRGRQGKNFYSPADTGLYMTLAVPMNCPITGQVTITTRVAVSVAKGIEKVFGIRPSIKWVNDIYVYDRKCCGILCEAINDFENGVMKYAVIGIGININTTEWPDSISGTAGSIVASDYSREKNSSAVFGNKDYPGDLADCITKDIIRELANRENRSYLDYYREYSNVIGKMITYTEGDAGKAAKAIDVDEEGGLVIETEEGKRRTLNSGEISIRVK